MEAKIIKSGNKRFLTYASVGVVLAAAIIATLIEIEVLTEAQIDSWVTRVGVLLALFLGLGQSILSMFNTDREQNGKEPEDGRHVV